jgi:WD40 repeat protein
VEGNLRRVNLHRTATFSGHRSGIYALANGDRPGTFFSSGGDGQVVRWSIGRPDAGELVATVDDAVFALHHVQEGQLLFIGRQDGGLHVIDLANRREVKLLSVHRKGIHAITALPGGRIACFGGDGTLSLWSMPGMDLLRQFPLTDGKLRAAKIDRDRGMLLVACGDGTLRSLDLEHFNELRTLQAHEGGVTCVTMHPAKPAIVSGGKDGHLRLWPAADGATPLLSIPAHRSTIYAIAFSPEGSLCATASRDKTVKLWDAATFDPIQRLDHLAGGHAHSVNALLWVDGTLISAGDDRRAIAWA